MGSETEGLVEKKNPFGLKEDEIEPVILDPNQRFAGGKLNDAWAVLVFALHLLVTLTIGLGGAYVFFFGEVTTEIVITSTDIIVTLSLTGIGLFIGAIFAVVYFALCLKMPATLIKLSLIGYSAIFFAYAALWAVLAFIYASFWLLIFAVVLVFLAFGVALLLFLVYRKSIPLTTAYITISINILKQFKAVILVPGTSVLLYLILMTLWVVTCTFSLGYLQSEYGAYILIPSAFWLLFSWYWTTEVVKGVARTSVSGVVGRWYFDDVSSPTSAVLKSFQRAVVTSFGSICFGSLIVAVIATGRSLINYLRIVNARARPNGLAGCFIKITVACWLMCLSLICLRIEVLMKYFNRYAFTFIAIYGMPYLKAGVSAAKLLVYQGTEAVMADCNLFIVQFTQAFTIACTTAFISTLCLVCLDLFGVVYDPSVFLICIIMPTIAALGIGMLTTEIVNYCIPAVLICSSDAPEKMEEKVPELYSIIRSKYPHLRCFREMNQSRI